MSVDAIVDSALAEGQLPGALRFPRSQALADTHHATVITTRGKSFRMRKKGIIEDKADDNDTAPGTLPKGGRKA